MIDDICNDVNLTKDLQALKLAFHALTCVLRDRGVVELQDVGEILHRICKESGDPDLVTAVASLKQLLERAPRDRAWK